MLGDSRGLDAEATYAVKFPGAPPNRTAPVLLSVHVIWTSTFTTLPRSPQKHRRGPVRRRSGEFHSVRGLRIESSRIPEHRLHIRRTRESILRPHRLGRS